MAGIPVVIVPSSYMVSWSSPNQLAAHGKVGIVGACKEFKVDGRLAQRLAHLLYTWIWTFFPLSPSLSQSLKHLDNKLVPRFTVFPSYLTLAQKQANSIQWQYQI